MLRFLQDVFIPKSYWGFAEYTIMIIFGIVAIILLFLVFLLMSWICKLIFYDFSYGEVKTYPGKVVGMKYTPSRTWTTTSVGPNNTMTTQTHYEAEKNMVYIETELKSSDIDSDKLYQRVRIGESVIVKYQDVFIKPKYWQGEWEYDKTTLVSVTSEKDQTIQFNDEEPVTYKKRGR